MRAIALADDGGDCCPTATCATTRGDGVCDSACNVAACGFDGGDCSVDAGLTWGGYDLAEQVGFDGLGKGGVGVVASGAHATLTACTFDGNRGELGGAFYVQGCRPDRSNDAPCAASLAVASSRLTLTRCSSLDNEAELHGGLVYATMQAVVSVDGHVAELDHAASEGGFVWAGQGSQLSLARSTVAESAAPTGGSLYLSDASAAVASSSVRCTKAYVATAGGAALLTDGASAVFTDSMLAECAAQRGGGVRLASTATAPRGPGRLDTYAITSAPTLRLEGTNVSNCTATIAGGGVDGVGTAGLRVEIVLANSTLSDVASVDGHGGGVAVADGVLSLLGSLVERGVAGHGAAIHASSASTVHLNGSALTSGNASADGGGVFATGATKLVVASGSRLSDNHAAESGGALHAADSTVDLEGGVRLEANAARLGGGLSAKGSVVAIADTTFELNTAAHGGGAYAHSSTVRAERVELLDNVASGSGGGVAAVETSRLEMSDSYARRNACPAGAGGALSLERSSVQLERSTFEENTAGSGGALSIAERAQSLPTPLVSNVTFVGNTAAAPASRGYTPASSAVKGEGGATYLSSSGTVRVEASTFASNGAKSGGALAAIASTTLELRGTDVRNNSAAVNGGGVMVVLAVLTSENDVFANNSAAAGGAAFFLSSEATLENATADGNAALSSGGALEVSNSQLALGRSRFTANRVPTGLGGALTLRSQATGSVTGTEFVGNSAANGAALAVQDASLAAEACELIGNAASESGGGFFGRGSLSFTLTNVTAEGNSAPDGGGAYLKESTPVLKGLTMRRNRAAVGAGLLLSGCTSAIIHTSTFEANNASESELVETTDSTAAGTVEGGGVFCEDSNLDLLNITLRANEAHSKAAMQGTGGGLAARSCVGPLSNVDFDENVANQAGGVLWKGSAVLRLLDGEFVANVGKVNPYAGAIMWGGESTEGGGVSGGGMSLEGCTRFADALGNALSLGSGCGGRRRMQNSEGADGPGAIASASRRWRHLTEHGANTLAPEVPAELMEATVAAAAAAAAAAGDAPTTSSSSSSSGGGSSAHRYHRRQLQGISASALGISTPVDRLSWTGEWANQGVPATSGALFPNCTYVAALDVYNNTSPTAEGLVTAVPSGSAAVCDVCGATAPLVSGVATFCTLGLTALPGTSADITFTSSVGAPSDPMRVQMALCQLGEYLDPVARLCRKCAKGQYTELAGASTTCIPCPAGTSSNSDGATACTPCAPGTAASLAGGTLCAVCAEGTYSNAAGTQCVPCPPGSYAPGRGNGFCIPCEPGTFQASSNSPSCLPCGDVPPSYSLAGATRCEVCHSGAYCTQGIYYGAKSGWWAYRPLDLNSSTDGGTKTVVSNVELYTECKPINGFNASRCEGGSASVCKAGHWGALCSLCEPYHYKGRTECIACDREAFNGTNGEGRKFFGIVTISIQAYHAETHRVAFELHMFMAACASIGIIFVTVCTWTATRDPEEALAKKKGKAAVKAALAAKASAMKRHLTRRPAKKGPRGGAAAATAAADAPPSPPPSPPGSIFRASTWLAWLEAQVVVGDAEPRWRDVGVGDKDDEEEEEDEGVFIKNNFGDGEGVLDEDAAAMGGIRPVSPLPSAPASPSPASPPPSPPLGDTTARILRSQKNLGVQSEGGQQLGDAASDVVSGSKEKMKILITHFQISSSFKFNLDMSLPWPNVEYLNDLFGWVNLDLISLANFECIQPLNFYDGLFATVLSATCLLIAVPLTCFTILSVQRLGWRLGLIERTERSERIREAFVNKSWNLFLMLCFFFFPPVSKRVFNTLHCVEILPDEEYMWADLSLRCWQGAHLYWVAFSVISMGVFTFGIPLFFCLILYSNQRKLLLQTPQCQARYGFLYSKYSDRVWWWEFVEMFRKLVFTSIIMFLSSGPSSQIVVAMAIAFVALILHLHTQAYKDEPDSWLQTSSLTAIFVTLWVGLLHKTGVTAELDAPGSSTASSVYEAILMTVTSMPIVVAALGLLLKVATLLSKFITIFCASEFCPDYGIAALLSGFLPGGTFERKQTAALQLALAVNTDAAGDLIVKQSNKAQARRASLTQAREAKALTRASTGLVQGDALEKIMREHAYAARMGKPITKDDRTRKLYLLPLRVSADAIVLRHYP